MHTQSNTNGLEVCAIDLGTTWGWAACSGEGLRSGTYKIAPEDHGARFFEFDMQLIEVDGVFKCPQCVYYEEVMRFISGASAKTYCGYRAILMQRCHTWNISCIGVGVGEIKKHATGKGNAPKDAMVAAAKAKRWTRVIDDNHADALALLDFALTRDFSTSIAKLKAHKVESKEKPKSQTQGYIDIILGEGKRKRRRFGK